jgi:hypothetical protein
MLKHRTTTLSALALFALTGLSSCISSSGSPPGTTYSFGSLDCSVSATPEKVVQASEKALKEKDLHMVSSDSTGVDGKVVAKTALDTTIAITVTRQDEKTSKLTIRVGTFGDQALSNDLLEKIRANLPSS